MSKICPQCNNVLDDNEKFCTRCGAQVDNPQPVFQQAPGQQAYSGQAAPPPPYYQQPQAQPVSEPPMTTGQWVGTIILTTWFGIISVILCFVWGFSETTPTAKKNYCRATLIIYLIGLALGVLFVCIFAAVFASMGGFEAMEEFFERLEYEFNHMCLIK